MSVSTHIAFLNENDPEFLQAKESEVLREEWELEHGSIDRRPGAPIEAEDAVQELDEEYGGWLIALKDIPKDATHVVIYRC